MARTRVFLMVLLFALVSLLFAEPIIATNYGIFVDGGYSPGDEDSAGDKLIDKRLDDLNKTMEKRDPDSKRTTVETKEALQKVLEQIECKCEDTLTIFLMGHGRRNRFRFTKERKSLRASELADWLEATAKECCCKIHVVIFSCHSGSFLDELFDKEHIESVYASCAANEKSHSDSDGDWLKGFRDDWEAVPKGTDLGDSLEESYESAEEAIPDEYWGRETPTGWRRGDLPVVAHVEGVGSRSLRVHYYEPKFIRSKTKRINTRDVDRPDGLRKCKWISFTGTFGKPDESVTPASDISEVDPPREGIVAHVRKVRRQKSKPYIIVHTIKPRWLYCHKQKLGLDDRNQIPDGLQRCNWIEQEVSITDPEKKLHTGEPINQISSIFQGKVHFRGRMNYRRGTFDVHFLSPAWLHCKNKTIHLRPEERGKLRSLRRCTNYLIDLELISDGTFQGHNLRQIHRQATSWDPIFDVAVHLPQKLAFSPDPPEEDELWRIEPAIAVTNVGQKPADFAVRAVIGPAELEQQLESWLEKPEGEPEAIWTGKSFVEELTLGETRSVAFESWVPPLEGGMFWVGFRIDLSGDENPLSDISSMVFEVRPHPEAEPAGDEVQDPPVEELPRPYE